jgi:hypothetical protein
MSNGDIVIPPTDLTSAAIDAVDLILSQLGISPLDILEGLFAGKPKFEDTDSVIAAYQQSAYWPLHALAAQMQIWVKNGAPISDSNPEVQKSFGVAKQGTVTSIQAFAGGLTGAGQPGYWTIFALIEDSWKASGEGEGAVLQYVKALDALTQVLSLQNGQTTIPPVVPPAPPGPAAPPCPPFQTLPDCLPQPGAPDQALDEIGQGFAGVAYWLQIISIYLMNIFQKGASAGTGNGGNADPVTCAQLTGLFDQLITAIGTVNTGGTAAPPPDLSSVVTALGAIAAAIGATPTTPTAPPPVDLSAIVAQLTQANTLQDVPAGVLKALQALAPVDPVAFGQLQGSPSTTVQAVINWLGTAFSAGVTGNSVGNWINNHPDDVNVLKNAITSFLEEIFGVALDASGGLFGPFVKALLGVHSAEIATMVNVQPGDEQAGATKLLTEAIGAGVSAHFLAVIGELAYPTKNLGLPSLAALMAELAGFGEIMRGIIGPEVNQAIAVPHRYAINAQARAVQYDARTAVALEARRLLPVGGSGPFLSWAGFADALKPALVANGFRPLQPRMFATLLQDVPFPTATVRDALQFAAVRDADIATLLPLLEFASTKNVRQQYVSAATRSTELGTMTPDELTGVLNDVNYSPDAQAWVQLTVATRKLEQLAELYRKSISEAYRYGTITDAQYVPSLEAIGIGAADAQAHYAVDSIAKTGKAAIAAEKAAARLAAKQMSAAGKAAIAGYRSGTLDAAALEAALLIAGFDPLVASFSVTVETLKREGNVIYVYGVSLPRSQAVLLREQVSALGVQVKAQLVTPAAALQALAGYGVPATNAQALVAEWAATVTPAADVGVLEPR